MNTIAVMFLITVIGIIMGALNSISTLSLSTNQNRAFAQGNNAIASSMLSTNQTQASMNARIASISTTTIPTLTKVGEKEFYLFAAEIEIPDVDKEKLKVAGDAFSITTMIVNKGDKVTIHFYNVDPNESERHSFTIGAPYNIDKDLASGESATLTFTADHEGIYQYYCKYHLPVMVGQLEVVS